MSDTLKNLLESEIDVLTASIGKLASDPAEKAAIIRMTNDLARLPIRMMQGEDVSLLVGSLRAEAEMRGVSFSLKTTTTVQQAWTNIITKVVTAAMAGVLA